MPAAPRPLSRWSAAAIHLALSGLVALATYVTVSKLWFPGALFGAAGGRDLFLVVTGSDVVIGPLLTLVVYRAGKKGLRFDLAVIALLQVGALAYGVHVLFEARPVWTVFLKDRFEITRANQVLPAERAKAKPPFDALSKTGPLLAAARMPRDPDEQFRIAISAASGQDVHTYPQYLIPYAEARQDVRRHAKPIAALAPFNRGAEEAIASLPARYARDAARLGFLPMRAGKHDLAAIVDLDSGDYLGAEPLKPWEFE